MSATALEILDPVVSQAAITREDGLRAAAAYVASNIDPSFKVTASNNDLDRPWETGRWRFFIWNDHAPLRAIFVETHSGHVIPFTADEIRSIREHGAIAEAKSQGVLPLNGDGYVLSEYARRRANSYLSDQVGMYFNAVDPVLVHDEPMLWQLTIVFKQYSRGPFTLGMMDVDASSGEPIPLTNDQLEQIRVRISAIIRHQTSTTEPV